MNTHYDIIVIGAGSAGLSVSIAMRRFGLSVLLIDRHERRIGGDCLNDGCVPSKALLHVSKQVHQARLATAYGPTLSGDVDLARVMQYIRDRQDAIRAHENAQYLLDAESLDVAIGTAAFVGPKTIRINGQEVSAKNMVLCTGSQPQPLKAEGIEQVNVLTHKTIFDLTELPKHLLVVGAGPNGIEMAQAFRRLGSEVTVVGRDERILPKEPAAASALLQERLAGEGIQFLLNAEIESFTDAHTAQVKVADGQQHTVQFDQVLATLGRTFDYGDINLSAAGIELDDKGRLRLNNQLQTTNQHVFAAGDAAAGAPAGERYFSHAAALHASLIITNFITPVFDKSLSYDHFSWVTFTDPEVATFGLSAKELATRKIAFDTIEHSFDKDDRAVVEDNQYARMWLLVEPAGLNPLSRKILGGTMVAPNAGELIQELILANQQGLPISAFVGKTYPYPTASNVNKAIWVDTIGSNIPGALKTAVQWLY
ncbi:dihydrolipoyl dehydrogenase family protein [Fibrella aquatilis]|uniref:FAD-dependent oxidoreductase n=1 Tax=Fibrella aquatilis TaxID=2817059 RepID=A0A939G9V6_9BACT|nr:FAD-dependent oxidoreductase [Fibrella aquatilis]MBO0933329.1 FAD-dependent oxidoreductase [Fibrella aquatilis]